MKLHEWNTIVKKHNTYCLRCGVSFPDDNECESNTPFKLNPCTNYDLMKKLEEIEDKLNDFLNIRNEHNDGRDATADGSMGCQECKHPFNSGDPMFLINNDTMYICAECANLHTHEVSKT